VFSRRIGRETCGQCHANARLVERYGLPRDNVAAFEDSFHGLALRAGQLAVANCASCHGAHDILPSSDPRSHTNQKNLPETCGKCHPGAGERFVIGKVHVVTAASPSRIEYWIRAVYLWLIAVVIGFMALHNGADLVRKARHGDRPFYGSLDVPERMPRVLRWQHGLVMLSFPLLAYTGFALTYPEAWWARPLLAWESRFALRGTLHRGAAIVLLGALFWHFVNLASSTNMRRRLRGLMWSRADLRHFLSMLAYYMGLRSEPPPGAPFTYIEKAEYWAFLWGMVIMTVTGFVLWFSDTTLRYLPKWVMDVATALHFYEAVLAALAILVWHFYWVIFDPEVYPMDWSWWNGKPPASRAIERGTVTRPHEQETEQGAESGATSPRRPAD
jgi:cytochrome b subunit of formate dehydrogenase